ncbi:hypothetical protein [Spirosoma gilvum]
MLLKRLNSYANQYPLYQALVELGKVVRMIFCSITWMLVSYVVGLTSKPHNWRVSRS